MTDVDLLELARGVVGAAREDEQIEAYAVRSRDVDVKVFDGEVESLTVAVIEGVGIRVIGDHRQGYAWSGSLDPEVVAETLADACDNAGFGAPDDAYALAAPDDFAGVAVSELDLWRDDLLEVSTERKVALALGSTRPRSRSTRACAVSSRRATATARWRARSRTHAVSKRAPAARCARSPRTQWQAKVPRRAPGAASPRRVRSRSSTSTRPRDAAERAVRLLGARQPASRRLPVVLDPLVTRSLLGLVGSALGGESIIKGRSLFVGREGENVAASHITVVDDPTIADAFGAATHDSEGVPTRRVDLIRDGRLDAFLHNVFTARKAGSTTTGSAVRGGFKSAPGVGARALFLQPGALTPEQIMASVPEALYVQTVSGLHSGTNIVSGDFSVGADGLMVRGGELAEPVREITIASTIQRMLLDIVHVGNDLRWLPGGGAGMTLLIGDMSIAGS